MERKKHGLGHRAKGENDLGQIEASEGSAAPVAAGRGRRASFSRKLAFRYLNPLRAFFSIITLICLLGVAFGVMVLVVVMSVMAGLESEIKNRVLGFSPHIQVWYQPGIGVPERSWEEMAGELASDDGVEYAGAHIEEFSLFRFRGRSAPVQFSGVDGADRQRIRQMEALISEGGQGSFDLGYDDRVVISDRLAQDYGVMLGDWVQLFSSRNSDAALDRFELTRQELLAVRQQEEIEQIKMDLANDSVVDEVGGDKVPIELINAIFDWAEWVMGQGLRPGEQRILDELLETLSAAKKLDYQPESNLRRLSSGAIAKLIAKLDQLHQLDKREEDYALLESLESIVLPKELEVVGIFQATSHVRIPDLFMPLNHARELAGLDADQVASIAVRTKDPFTAQLVVERLATKLPEGWYALSWMDQFGQWFALIERERWMMRIALGCIMLVSAFCIGAVMFTITLQKKREIGVMKALGARAGQIVMVFVYQGVLIGVVGGLLGILLGWLVIVYRESIQRVMAGMGFDPFPSDFHGVSSIPAIIDPLEVLVITLCAIFFCTLAAWIPAFFSARSDAARSLRSV